MRISLFLAAAGLFALPAPASAGRPVNGYFYFTMIRDAFGDNYGKVEWNWDGRRVFSLGTPQTFPRLPDVFGVAYAGDSSLLIAGKYTNEVYKVKPGEAASDTRKNVWDRPEHIYVEPGLKSAWITDNRGYLYHAPLDPMGQADEVRPTGSDNGVNTIAYRDANVAWYTQNALGSFSDSVHIGELDTRTMATRRRLSIAGTVNDSRFDPFTGHVLMCGGTTLSQYDPGTNAIVSQRALAKSGQLYSCVVDGEGHVLLSSWDGYVYFIDYSATGKVGEASNPIDSAMLTDRLYFLTPLIGPGSPPKVKRPIYAGIRGGYRDADGDGRIDGAVLEFKSTVNDPPTQVRLADPADPAKSLILDSTHIVKLDFTHFLLDFRDSPLPFGTVVAPGASVRILQDTSLFGDGDLPMGDEVGPQVIAAATRPPQNKGDKPELTVAFSEEVKIDSSAHRFPFLVKRSGNDVSAGIQVESIQSLGNNRYKYVFASSDFPLLGDSLKLIPGDPGVPDLAGNLNNMSIWIPVGGDGYPAFAIQPETRACLASYPITSPAPPSPAVLLVDPVPAGGRCLNCPDNRVAASLEAYPPTLDARKFEPWLMTLKIQGPIRYSLQFFNTLGAYMNGAEGEVTADMLRAMSPGQDHLYTLRLYWWPVTPGGRLAATGAYIVRGTLSGDGLKGPAAVTQATPAAPGAARKIEKVSATFGYLRRD